MYMVRGLKFLILEVKGLYYLHVCGENKGADQLHGYPASDLRICFCIRKKTGFQMSQLKLLSEQH